NERCLFCWLDPYLSDLPHGLIKNVIKYIIDEKDAKRIITFTGGEPTLNPHLTDYIKMVSDAGFDFLELQTNALRCANAEYARLLVQSGLTRALISLHGHTAEISDKVTRTPGGFAKTVAGARNLVNLGVAVTFNYVMNIENYQTTQSYLEFIISNFPQSQVVLSIVGPSYAQELYRNALPRLSDQAPYIIECKKMYDRKLIATGFTCGMPPCVLADSIELFLDEFHPVVIDGDLTSVFFKKETCNSCSLNDFCFGFWRNYVDVYGDDEMKPIPESPLIKKFKGNYMEVPGHELAGG
ncbi:MAG: radical SAM protein, partial [bacterium]